MSIKRTIITTATIVVAVAMVASVVGAQTPTIAQLMAEIQSLTAQLQALQGTPATTMTGSVPAACAGITFTRNLTVGSTGSDVKCLQAILNMSASTQVSTTGAGSPGYETTTFGPKTLAAVRIWQAAQGLTPANQIGPMSRAKLNALLGGTVVVTPGQTTPVIVPQSGSISAVLASDTPPMGSLIGGQATADMLHINFMGTGVVTSVTLQRSGISDQNLFTNVYLYDGATRITDGYSFNVSGQIVMNGLNIVVNGSHEISVRGDVESSAATGGLEGTATVSLTAYTGNGAAMNANVMGSLMTIVGGSTAGVSLGANTVTGTIKINAGTMGYTFWSAPVTVTTRAVLLKTANFKMVGSAPSDALGNIRLFIDGIDTGKVATVTTISGSNYASFDLTSAPITLTTGSHTMDMRADVQKGSDRDVTVSIQLASDLTIADPQVGVNIAAAGTIPNSGTDISINTGSVTVAIDPTFTSLTNISGGATNAVIGRFTLHAYGEDVKVSTLQVNPYVANGDTGSSVACTGANGSEGSNTCGLENITLYLNGVQVGTQKNFTQTANSSATEASTTAANDMPVFTLGSQMIIPAGQDSTLEVRADLLTTGSVAYTSGTVYVTLPFLGSGTTVNYLNGQGQTSQATVSVPASYISTTGLAIQSTSLQVAENTAYSNQSVSPNTQNSRIGSYVIQNQSTSESIRLTTLKVYTLIDPSVNPPIATDATAILDLSSLRTSDTTGSGSTPIQPTGTDTFSVSDVLAPGASMTVDIFANTGGTAVEYIRTELQVTGIGSVDNISTTIPTNAHIATITNYCGQTITIGTGAISSFPTLVVSSTTPSQYIASASGAANASQAAYNFYAASGSATISEMKFRVDGITTATNICVGTACASPVAGVADLTGLSIAVPNGGGGYTANVQVSYPPVGTNGLATNTPSTVYLVYAKYTAGGATKTIGTEDICASTIGGNCITDLGPTETGNGIAAKQITLVGSKPTLTVSSTVGTGMILDQNNQIGQVTIASDPQGQIKVRQITFAIGNTGFTTYSSITSPYLSVNGSIVTNAYCATSGSPTSTITCEFGTGTYLTSVGTVAYANDYPISAGNSVTFQLFATVNGTNTSTTGQIAQISSSLTNTTGKFLWDDSSMGGTSESPSVGVGLDGVLINGFPINAYSVHQ